MAGSSLGSAPPSLSQQSTTNHRVVAPPAAFSPTKTWPKTPARRGAETLRRKNSQPKPSPIWSSPHITVTVSSATPPREGGSAAIALHAASASSSSVPLVRLFPREEQAEHKPLSV